MRKTLVAMLKMKAKTNILFIVLLFISLTSKSQTFVSDTKLWNVYTSYFWNCYTEIYKLTTDTTINNFQYKKVHLTTLNNDTSMYYNEIIGYIREGSTNKVYIKYADQNDEKLIYDFNLNVGDTTYIYSNTNEAILDSVSTIQINDSSIRRIFYFNTGNIWIQGIGDISNPFYHNESMFDISHHLICYSESDTLKYYDNINFTIPNNDCSFAPLTISKLKKNSLFISYKDNRLMFNLSDNLDLKQVSFSDMLGKNICFSQESNNVFQLKNDLPEIIFYKVLLSDNTIRTGKIMTNKHCY